MTNGHRITNLVTRLLSVPADIEGGDAVAEGIPSGLNDALSIRNDLVGRLPLAREVEHELRLVGNRVGGFPVDHCLIHPPSVEVSAERGRELVDVGVNHLVLWSAPPESAMRVFRVTVQ